MSKLAYTSTLTQWWMLIKLIQTSVLYNIFLQQVLKAQKLYTVLNSMPTNYIASLIKAHQTANISMADSYWTICLLNVSLYVVHWNALWLRSTACLWYQYLYTYTCTCTLLSQFTKIIYQPLLCAIFFPKDLSPILLRARNKHDQVAFPVFSQTASISLRAGLLLKWQSALIISNSVGDSLR